MQRHSAPRDKTRRLNQTQGPLSTPCGILSTTASQTPVFQVTVVATFIRVPNDERCVLLLVRVFAFAMLMPTAILASESPHNGPKSILSAVRADGPRKVVDQLYAPGGHWHDVMAKISRGGGDWLEVAVALQPGTDGGASEELDEAIFFALAPAAEAVLKLLRDRRFDLNFVCSSNVGVDYSASKSRRLIKERLTVLQRVRDPELLATKDRCEQGLRAALKDFDRPGAYQ
jgi:hypothetical protein